MQHGPLSGFTVIDATRVRAGPTAVRFFADLGARVIKLEIPEGAPGTDDMIGGRNNDIADSENLHRNKESITINLKEPEGISILKKLVSKADVFIENFRPDVKYRLGISPDELSAVNPQLIYASISGFGQTGPYANKPGFDSIAQGMGGLMSVTGKPGDGPMRVGIPIADLSAGYFCAIAIMAALLNRNKTGKGDWVHTSLLEAQIAMLDFQAVRWLVSNNVPKQDGNDHPMTVPTGVYKTSDGYVNVAAIGDNMWRRLCKAIEKPHLAEDIRFCKSGSRLTNRKDLNKILEGVFLENTSSYWTDKLMDHGVPAGPILEVDQVFANLQVEHLGMKWPMQHSELGNINVLSQPINFSSYPKPASARQAPKLGENTEKIMVDLGYTPDEILHLRTKHII